MRKICSSRNWRRIRVFSSRAESTLMAERLFDHHPAPPLRSRRRAIARPAARLAPIARPSAQKSDRRRPDRTGSCRRSGNRGATSLSCVRNCSNRWRSPKSPWIYAIRAVSRCQDSVIHCVDAVFAVGIVDEPFQHFAQAASPVTDALTDDVDADDGEPFRHQSGAREVVQRREQQPVRQVAAGTEDHHGAGPWRLRLPPRRRL